MRSPSGSKEPVPSSVTVVNLKAWASGPAEATGARFGPQASSARQLPAQHWLEYVHALPFARHPGAAQIASRHVSGGAQSAVVPQAPPVRLVAHLPAGHEPVQHSEDAEHAADAGVHAGG